MVACPKCETEFVVKEQIGLRLIGICGEHGKFSRQIEYGPVHPGILDCEQIANMGRDDGSKVMGVFGSPWKVVSMPKPDPFDDIENFRLSKEDAAKITMRSVSSKSVVECRLDKLETLVKRIASHLGIEE